MPYECNYCDRKFRNGHNCKIHERNWHASKILIKEKFYTSKIENSVLKEEQEIKIPSNDLHIKNENFESMSEFLSVEIGKSN